MGSSLPTPLQFSAERPGHHKCTRIRLITSARLQCKQWIMMISRSLAHTPRSFPSPPRVSRGHTNDVLNCKMSWLGRQVVTHHDIRQPECQVCEEHHVDQERDDAHVEPESACSNQPADSSHECASRVAQGVAAPTIMPARMGSCLTGPLCSTPAQHEQSPGTTTTKCCRLPTVPPRILTEPAPHSPVRPVPLPSPTRAEIDAATLWTGLAVAGLVRPYLLD